jgi:hypothetical protein
MRMSHASGRQKYIEHFGYEAWKEETTKLKWVKGKLGLGVSMRFIWLRIGTGGRLMWTQEWTSRFHKMWRISWLAEHSFPKKMLLHGVSLLLSCTCKCMLITVIGLTSILVYCQQIVKSNSGMLLRFILTQF